MIKDIDAQRDFNFMSNNTLSQKDIQEISSYKGNSKIDKHADDHVLNQSK